MADHALKNSLLASVGYLELANAKDFAANVWNDVPVPKCAMAFMAIGGVLAIGLSDSDVRRPQCVRDTIQRRGRIANVSRQEIACHPDSIIDAVDSHERPYFAIKIFMPMRSNAHLSKINIQLAFPSSSGTATFSVWRRCRSARRMLRFRQLS